MKQGIAINTENYSQWHTYGLDQQYNHFATIDEVLHESWPNMSAALQIKVNDVMINTP
jgi:hypothetical protein